MQRLLAAVAISLPATVLAHPGHQHVPSELLHHTLEGGIIVAAVALGVLTFRHFRAAQKRR